MVLFNRSVTTLDYIASKHQKEFMDGLNPVYRAVSKERAETELNRLDLNTNDITQLCFVLGISSGQIYRFTLSILSPFERSFT